MAFKAVRFVGERDFQRFGVISRNMRDAYEPFRLEYLQHIQKLMARAKEVVFAAQDFKKLNENYKQRKEVKGLNPMIWAAYGHTFRQIAGIIARNSIYLGVRSGKRHPYTGDPLSGIVARMELGTGSGPKGQAVRGKGELPARPLLAPTLELVGQWLDKEKNYRAYRMLYHMKAKVGTPMTHTTYESMMDTVAWLKHNAFMNRANPDE